MLDTYTHYTNGKITTPTQVRKWHHINFGYILLSIYASKVTQQSPSTSKCGGGHMCPQKLFGREFQRSTWAQFDSIRGWKCVPLLHNIFTSLCIGWANMRSWDFSSKLRGGGDNHHSRDLYFGGDVVYTLQGMFRLSQEDCVGNFQFLDGQRKFERFLFGITIWWFMISSHWSDMKHKYII